MQEVKQRISELENKVKELKEQRDDLRYQVGNILHDSVPSGENEEDNKEIKTWEPEEKKKRRCKACSRYNIRKNDLVETEKAAELAGERAYYLKGDLFRLNQALIQFSMDLLREKGFTPMQTPYMLKHKAYGSSCRA